MTLAMIVFVFGPVLYSKQIAQFFEGLLSRGGCHNLTLSIQWIPGKVKLVMRGPGIRSQAEVYYSTAQRARE